VSRRLPVELLYYSNCSRVTFMVDLKSRFQVGQTPGFKYCRYSLVTLLVDYSIRLRVIIDEQQTNSGDL
jgi:hypothetical protein